jgi:hypothetical protein
VAEVLIEGSKEMTMLKRIATWSLALACWTIASAEAAPPAQEQLKQKQLPAARAPEIDPSIKLSPPKAGAPVTENGRIERYEDGTIFYSVELSQVQREQIAKYRGLPLTKVPDRIVKSARVSAAVVSPRAIKSKIGQEVSIELRQDPHGFVFATNLGAPKR